MKKDISKRLGENVKRIRLAKKLSQGDVCRALGLDRGYMSSLESGKRNPTVTMIERIASALNTESSELLK